MSRFAIAVVTKLSLILTAGLVPPLAFGIDYFYCNKTSVYVHVGDSISQVNSICDKPTRIEKKLSQRVVTHKPVEQWVYNFQPNSGFREDLGEVTQVKFQKDALVVNFDRENISQIFVKEKPVYQTNFCRPDLFFTIGDTKQTVIQFCAKPSVMHNVMEEDIIDTREQVIYIYQTDPYTPTTNLVFENNKLVNIIAGNPG